METEKEGGRWKEKEAKEEGNGEAKIKDGAIVSVA
jgi:hypothetical protein